MDIKSSIRNKGRVKKKPGKLSTFCGYGGGGHQMWIKKFLNVNIINFENVDKPEGGGVRKSG
jgi:hypothetical protein